MTPETIIVVGLGEIGKPLMDILSRHYRVIGVDITPPPANCGPVDVMHVCFPFQVTDFVGETLRYIDLFKPALTVINSTVAVGTTRQIAELAGAPVAHSPVRGKHIRMNQDMAKYTKFIGPVTPSAGLKAATHFQSAGLATTVLSSPEASELAKLTETTYFGLLIAWAQQLERFCDQTGVSYPEVTSFYEEIAFLPPVTYFPGVIGGHCVMPNIEILSTFASSPLVEAIRTSNMMKIERDQHAARQYTSPVEPIQVANA